MRPATALPAGFGPHIRLAGDTQSADDGPNEAQLSAADDPLHGPEGAARLPPPGDESLKLSPPSTSPNRDTETTVPPSPLRSLVTVISSLAVVLGLFLLLVWISRRGMSRGMAVLSREVVEVLGRAPLAGRQQMHLIRVGSKLLLVSVTPSGAETLTEIIDPEEVQRLAGICQQNGPGSATTTFRQIFSQLANPQAVDDRPGANQLSDRRAANSASAPGVPVEDVNG